MKKQDAMRKWEKAGKVTAENVKTIFPTRAELLEFWNDVKTLSWPEYYGCPPWDTASHIASMAAGSLVTNPHVLNSAEYKAAMSY